MRVSGEEGEYENPQETTKDQGARGIKDRNRREKPKEYEKRATPLLQPPPKTLGESQTKRVKVVLNKTPLQTGKEGMRDIERPEVRPEEEREQEGTQKQERPKKRAPSGQKGGRPSTAQ